MANLRFNLKTELEIITGLPKSIFKRQYRYFQNYITIKNLIDSKEIPDYTKSNHISMAKTFGKFDKESLKYIKN